jgi:DNA-binding transcriptional MerR regulator
MKVGEVAKRTGLSVRTLHYYDEIGLLSPAEHTASRHRLYGAPEILRLQQIKSLRQLGFSLDEIREMLDSPTLSPRRVLEMHAALVSGSRSSSGNASPRCSNRSP